MSNESDHALDRFFASTKEGYSNAPGAGGSFDISLLDHTLRIHFAGPALLHLMRPLKHLVMPSARQPPSFEIFVWEGPESWLPPTPCWKMGQQTALGGISGLHSDRFSIYYHDQSGLLCMCDRAARKSLYWIRNAQKLPYWETGSPFRILFHWWALSMGAHMAHAAAVGAKDQGILLAGRGGAGKSTLTLASLDAGMTLIGDDYVLLKAGTPPRAYSLYSSAKIHSRFLHEAFPHWGGAVAQQIGPESKSLFMLEEWAPTALRKSFAIRAVVLPKVEFNQTASIVKISSTDALLAMAPSTIFQLPSAHATAMNYFRRWMEGLPAYRMTTGRSLPEGPRMLRALLELGESEPAACVLERPNMCLRAS